MDFREAILLVDSLRDVIKSKDTEISRLREENDRLRNTMNINRENYESDLTRLRGEANAELGNRGETP